MKTLEMPILKAGLSTKGAMKALIERKAHGAVVKRKEGYHVVSLDDVAQALKRQASFADIATLKLDPEDVVRVASETKTLVARFKIDSTFKIAAPIYACPKRDYNQTSPGTCPFHDLPLEKVKAGA